MEYKLAYLQSLRNEIIETQKSRNIFVGLKLTASGLLVPYSLKEHYQIIIFAALIAVILDFLILGLSMVIKEISFYIRINIEEPLGKDFEGWETYLYDKPKAVRIGRTIASITSGPMLTLMILVLAVFIFYVNKTKSPFNLLSLDAPFVAALTLVSICWLYLLIKSSAILSNQKGRK